MRFVVLYPEAACAKLAWLIILAGQPRKLGFNSSASLFLYDNSSIKKNMGDFVLIPVRLGFGTKPMVSSA